MLSASRAGRRPWPGGAPSSGDGPERATAQRRVKDLRPQAASDMQGLNGEIANRRFWYPLRAAPVSVKQTLPDERGIEFERKLIDLERQAEVGSMYKAMRSRIRELERTPQRDVSDARAMAVKCGTKPETAVDTMWWMLPKGKTKLAMKSTKRVSASTVT